jgi:hypothetical protein
METGRKSDPYYITKKAKVAFRKLKERFQSPPILRLYNLKLLIRFETDIFKFAIKIIIFLLFLIENDKRKK